MTAPVIPATENAFIGYGIETTPGTPVSAAIFSPLLDPDWTPKQTYLQDIGTRGDPTMDHDDVMGVASAEMGWKTNLFADAWPYLFHGLLGTEAVTGTVAPYTHTEGVANNQVGSQPPSLTVIYFDGGTLRRLAWTQLTKMDISMAVDAAITATLAGISLPAGTTSVPSETYNNEHMVPSWDTQVTLGTVVSSAVESLDISIERLNSLPIHTAGQQNAHANFAGPIRVTGKFGFVYDLSDGIAPNVIAEGLERLQQSLNILFTDPATSHTVSLQMTTTQLEDPKLSVGKSYLEVESSFRAIGNATDAVQGGTSPIKVTCVNAQSAAA
jgi:hypothetical protein